MYKIFGEKLFKSFLFSFNNLKYLINILSILKKNQNFHLFKKIFKFLFKNLNKYK